MSLRTLWTAARENPLLYDFVLQTRRLKPTNWRSQQALSMALVAMIVVSFMYFALQTARYMNVSPLLFVIQGANTLVVPIMLHPVLAAEYQNRSLEVLMASPLSAWQVVLAKLLRAVVPVLATTSVVLFVMASMRVVQLFNVGNNYDQVRNEWVSVPVGLLATGAWAFFVASFTIWVSSLAKTTSAALLATIGGILGSLVMIPMVVAPLTALNFELQVAILRMHPFPYIGALVFPEEGRPFEPLFMAIPPVLWVGAGVCCLWLASRKLARQRGTGVES